MLFLGLALPLKLGYKFHREGIAKYNPNLYQVRRNFIGKDYCRGDGPSPWGGTLLWREMCSVSEAKQMVSLPLGRWWAGRGQGGCGIGEPRSGSR